LGSSSQTVVGTNIMAKTSQNAKHAKQGDEKLKNTGETGKHQFLCTLLVWCVARHGLEVEWCNLPVQFHMPAHCVRWRCTQRKGYNVFTVIHERIFY
jgi:hypothetical protein